MNETIKIEVEADLYRAIEQRAASLGLSLEDCLKYFFFPLADKRVVMPGKPYTPKPVEAHFGSFSSKNPTATTNDMIDRILAEEAGRGLSAT